MRRTLLAVRNTDETGASPSQTATRQRNCLYFQLTYKILQKGRFPWPSASDGTARLTSAQLAMLWEGIDWRRPDWGAPPARVG
ncbi:IS66 family insertion sequence element accessory protein TnpB [Phyllobacterium phragmitis]|uniref:IS66 family insertion sequence element accessory protein TnpB n=1 Tax=Phyllobacterium phragmitis TaxID=2670329 RepID=UPI0024782C56|nr:IS66 family insertion sequence element accessory protein TnpB [Phyllobacterium phragmitis]